MAKERGTVKWFDPAKRYGFIKRPGKEDIFIHESELPEGVELLLEDEKVEFEVVQGKKGMIAKEVRIIG